ncbi:hypothetical protein K2O51_07140 [Cupriavidus pinatubonensis]|uniref:hypothetical protein n=1 Tax=Cupriavidus pinatubonensis TaxID=248026 RepID=UPI001C72B6F3|nr:hypothetical protein [Cupriavidus pinatubonensis]QYY27712.1 hypothetical protein K2O51_07140 [Cupriavidus pinatubonensis]
MAAAAAGRDKGSLPESRGVHRLRAVVATYRPEFPAYTLAVSPAELLALSAMPGELAAARDPRAHAHLERLREDVHGSGIALPGAIVVAVSGGHMHCECDHLYALEMRPQAGDRLIVIDGYDRLLALAHSERRHCQTLVSAVLWHTAMKPVPAACGGTAQEATASAMAQSAAARWANAARVWH